MRKLFISFTTLAEQMSKGTLTPDDLGDGLFYFDCAREHVLSEDPACVPKEIVSAFAGDPERGRDVYAAIREALDAAETEGRLVWRAEQPCWSELSALLTQVGVSGVNDDDTFPCGNADIAEEIRNEHVHLEVVWSGWPGAK